MTPKGKLKLGLHASALGVVWLVGGLGLDAYLHGRDPGLAARESVFSLGNPAHALAGAGLVLTVLGVGTSLLALYTPRRRYVATALLGLVVVAAGAVAVAGPTMDGHEHQPAESHSHAAEHAGSLDAEASELLESVKKTAAKYEDSEAARADGFVPNPDARGLAVHWRNRDYIQDDAILDPERPEGLVYLTRDGSERLVGVFFKAPRGVDPPNPGGIVWHTHMPGCDMHDDSCFAGHMIHVWTADGVVDPFADNLRQALGGRRGVLAGA